MSRTATPWTGLAALLITLVAVGPARSAQLYRWTDEAGVTHYTAEPLAIPPAYRERADVLTVPQPRPAPPAPPRPSGPPGADAAVVPYTAGRPILVEARLNGVVLSLILDTGADRTVISPTALARAGFGAAQARPIEIVGVTGSAPASVVVIPRLDVAGAMLGPLSVVAHTVALEGPAGPVDGLLGRDALDAFTVTVDAASGRATLTPR